MSRRPSREKRPPAYLHDYVTGQRLDFDGSSYHQQETKVLVKPQGDQVGVKNPAAVGDQFLNGVPQGDQVGAKSYDAKGDQVYKHKLSTEKDDDNPDSEGSRNGGKSAAVVVDPHWETSSLENQVGMKSSTYQGDPCQNPRGGQVGAKAAAKPEDQHLSSRAQGDQFERKSPASVDKDIDPSGYPHQEAQVVVTERQLKKDRILAKDAYLRKVISCDRRKLLHFISTCGSRTAMKRIVRRVDDTLRELQVCSSELLTLTDGQAEMQSIMSGFDELTCCVQEALDGFESHLEGRMDEPPSNFGSKAGSMYGCQKSESKEETAEKPLNMGDVHMTNPGVKLERVIDYLGDERDLDEYVNDVTINVGKATTSGNELPECKK